jgi:molybdopterin synthase catalytic subunit
MKLFISAFSLFVRGFGAIFDFAGFLREENLHEKHDATAIRKDWRMLRSDYSASIKNITGRISGISK